MVSREAEIVIERQNAVAASQAALMHMALLSVPNQAVKDSSRQKVARDFAETIRRLTKGR